MNCSACGAENDGHPSTCAYCGSPLSGGAATSSAAPSPQPHPAPSAGMPGAGLPLGGGASLGRFDREKQQGAKVGLGVFAALSLICGVGGFVFSGKAQELRREAGKAMVRSAEDAADSEGLVCIEAVVPEVAQPYRIPGTEIDCLYVEEKRETRERDRRRSSSSSSNRSRTRTHTTTREHAAPSFALGPIAVQTAGADYRGTRQLHQTHDRAGRDETTVTWSGIEVDTPVTVLGHLKDGKLGGPSPFVISTEPTHAALLDSLQSSATMLKVLGVLGILVGLGAGGAAAFAFRG